MKTESLDWLADNPFYALVPQPLIYPMVILSTVATIIASQALISGAYSLTRQAVQLGFCPRGEASGFIADGAIEVGGRLPLNTHGGQLGEAYIHGMNGIAEAVRQLRGTSVNQVPGEGPVLVTAGTGVPTSGLILS